jgi:type IV pilus assembly protein PilA
MKKIHQGFTLIELMIVVAIIAILAAIAIPAYQDYTIRSQASEAMTLAAGAKTAVAETFAQTGKAPLNRTAAGMTATATDTAGQYVTGIDIGNGVITATYGKNANTKITAKTVKLVPYISPDGSVAWRCNSATAGKQPAGVVMTGAADGNGTLPSNYAPSQCRP